MYGFFYPENGERFISSLSFQTAQEAIDYWKDKRGTWQEIKAGSKDNAAFMNPNTGDIVVVRRISE
jgi:hypothetical protein